MSGWQHDQRSRHARGYGTAWDKKRKVILKRDNYLCQCDGCKGGELRVRPANEVDHRIGKAEWLRRFGNLDGCDDDSNLQAMHPSCHAAKTQRESGNPSRTVGCDADGWPLEGAGAHAAGAQPEASGNVRSSRSGLPGASAVPSRLVEDRGRHPLRQGGSETQDRSSSFESAPPIRKTTREGS